MLGFKFPRNPRFQRTSSYIRRFRIAVYLILGILAAGITGFMVLSDAPFWDAVYMTIITISTVGYGEVVELNEMGRIFTSFLIITNLGIFAYAVSIITSFIMEGNFQRLIKDYRVYQKIRNLEKHVIVCGYGRHGYEVTSELIKQEIPFVIIEKEEEKIEELREDGKFLYIDGDATHDDILEEAGIERAASLIATLGEDADNVFVVLSARQLNPKLRIISRAFNEKAEAKLIRAGADHVIQPERIGGFYMATMVQKPDVVEFMTLLSNMGSAQIVFEEFNALDMRNEYQGKTIREVNFRGLTGANIIGIHDEKGYYIINPTPDTLIRKGAKLVVLGNQTQMRSFKTLILKK